MQFTALILALIVMAFGSYEVAAADVNVCGQLNAYQSAIGKDGKAQDIILSLKSVAGFVDYHLVLSGTIPADLGQNPALAETLALTGRSVEGMNTVADYTVTRVASCGSLPSTSTSATTSDMNRLAGALTLLLFAAFAVAGTLVIRTKRVRYLIGALFVLAILFGAAPGVAAAASVGCGRVTTFVAPNSADGLPSGDGWVIFAKPDGSSEKVILRAGTQVGTLAGYICVTSEGVYLTGQLATGAAGYIAEPADWVTGTVVYCGSVAVNSFSSGQLSGPRTFELRMTKAPAGSDHFTVPESIPLPSIGSYLCGRFERGAPSKLVTVLRAGDPSYVAAGSLPSTSTSLPTDRTVSVLGALGTALLAVLGLLVLKAKQDRSVRGA